MTMFWREESRPHNPDAYFPVNSPSQPPGQLALARFNLVALVAKSPFGQFRPHLPQIVPSDVRQISEREAVIVGAQADRCFAALRAIRVGSFAIGAPNH
jgi:hypothetical protein